MLQPRECYGNTSGCSADMYGYVRVSHGKNAVNQALIYELICSRESRAKSMIDFINEKSIGQSRKNIYQLILLRINSNIHCKIHKKPLNDFAHDFSIVNPV